MPRTHGTLLGHKNEQSAHSGDDVDEPGAVTLRNQTEEATHRMRPLNVPANHSEEGKPRRQTGGRGAGGGQGRLLGAMEVSFRAMKTSWHVVVSPAPLPCHTVPGFTRHRHFSPANDGSVPDGPAAKSAVPHV